MVENGHPNDPTIIDIAYRNPHCPALGIEVETVEDVRRRTPVDLAGVPQRLDFHLLVLVTGGVGVHMVDFVDHDCRPGTLLWVRPGQVHRYPRETGLRARLVLFTPEFPPPLSVRHLIDDPFGPAHWQPYGNDSAELSAYTDLLVRAHERHEGGPGGGADGAVAELLRHLLGALLLRVAQLPEPEGEAAPAGHGELFARFRAELERGFAEERSVAFYADRLATTPKTLTRASLEATGRPAKSVIDARVALEAKRLLAHTDLTAAAIGRRLGFSEAANFGKFFARAAGSSPGEFRGALNGRADGVKG
ncbi:helix-turn-helix transcriptional regulator [Streptomyces sp. NPDC001941]|uniref:helix-turn-helix domain-containing protein n=1 Tax=Streptomyces sp. NPDC001941 TaxID=3154659 RepID=UPI00332D1506